MYASQGVCEVRELMKDNGVAKEPAISWIQIKNKVHCFRIADKAHYEIEGINSKLNDLYHSFTETGYVVPNTNLFLHDVEEEQKQGELLYHGEMLAVVDGIMHTPDQSPIRVSKNLRICGDCHSFMKFVSKISQHKLMFETETDSIVFKMVCVPGGIIGAVG